MRGNAVVELAPIGCGAISLNANGSAGVAILRARSCSNCSRFYRERSR
ncbi:hypothetical protein [Agrobacterium radiobacter]|nr:MULTISPECIES: hypothetical protein [Agrobacterium tumefaciens complex]NIB11125.1 hypothetical protein [Agrobacterium radiobacter]